MFDNYPPGVSPANNAVNPKPVVDMYAGLSQSPSAVSQQLPPQSPNQNQYNSLPPMEMSTASGGGLKFLVIGLVTLVLVLVGAVVAYQMVLKPKFNNAQPIAETPVEISQEQLLEEVPIVSSTDSAQTEIIYTDTPSSTTSSLETQAINSRQASSSSITTQVIVEQDTDGDGLLDDLEVLKGTDKNKADSDGDGLTDPQEVNQHQTDPMKADSDGDGLSDGEEINRYQTKPLQADTDGDGFSDGQEVKNNYNPLGSGRLMEPKR
jgi:hypothetical protein